MDDPHADNLKDIIKLRSGNVRVRVNDTNAGASQSRNNDLNEATAEWVLFLDDDVEITDDCLVHYCNAIHERGDNYCGFVGTTVLPNTTGIWHEATRMSYITFFYNLPSWFGEQVPWGVTANILVRRNDAVRFDVDYAKTGGGEDVDYCIKLREASGLPFGRSAGAVVYHEWWPCHSKTRYLHR